MDPTPVPLTRVEDRLSVLGGLVGRAGRTARQFAAEAGVSIVTATSLCRGNWAARQDRILMAVAAWLNRTFPGRFLFDAGNVRDLATRIPRGRTALAAAVNQILEKKGHRPA